MRWIEYVAIGGGILTVALSIYVTIKGMRARKKD